MKPIRSIYAVTREAGRHLTFLYDLRSERIYKLVGRGAILWRLCDGHHSMEEIAAVLQSQLKGTTPSKLMEETERLLADLSSAGLVDGVA